MVLSRNCHGYMVLSFLMSLDFLIIAIAESGMAEIMPQHSPLESGLQLQCYNKIVHQLDLSNFLLERVQKMKIRGMLKFYFTAQRYYLDIPVTALFCTADFLRTFVAFHAC